MAQENIFPVNVQLWIRFVDGDGTLLREIPFRYTVKHARHWGLLKRAYRYNGTRRVPSLTNKHFDRYAGVMANIALNCLTDTDWVTVQVVGPNLVGTHRQEDVYGTKVIHLYMLNTIEWRHKHKSFYAVKGLMRDTLRGALVSFVSIYLDKAGYRPQHRPRKYLHEKRKEWRDYKGLAEALLTKREAYISIDRTYQGSLFNIAILPEVLKHAGNTYVFWAVNTPEQMIEAQLLHANGSVTVRKNELEELEL
jgi:hypothetical protein